MLRVGLPRGLPHRLVAAAVLALTAGLLWLPAAVASTATTPGAASGAATPPGAETTAPDAARTLDERVGVGPEPDGTPVALDTTTFFPDEEAADGSDEGVPRPAVLLTHGFGGSKADVVGQALEFVARGFVVLTYTARGFGDSDGRIHLADPAYEGADQRVLTDRLAGLDEVLLDGAGDPRIAVVGASYGGALALMAGATDPRVDTVVAAITWNDLGDAFFPQYALSTSPPDTDSPADVPRAGQPGPFKQLWSSRFFLATAGTGGAEDPVCGRFDPQVCRLFLRAAETGAPSEALLDLLAAHSPAPLLDGLSAPTYLVQGMADTLFGVEQADATARTLLAQGTPVAVRWMDGGHDALSTTAEDDATSVTTWLSHYLDRPPEGADDLPLPAFVYAEPLEPGASLATLSRGGGERAAAPPGPGGGSGVGPPPRRPPPGRPAA
ncbi:MAG: alpha/beta hydrolase, partial [Nocardioides sp.]|nr:alpha/beta hydrolase [Nocardioides sp.]